MLFFRQNSLDTRQPLLAGGALKVFVTSLVLLQKRHERHVQGVSLILTDILFE